MKNHQQNAQKSTDNVIHSHLNSPTELSSENIPIPDGNFDDDFAPWDDEDLFSPEFKAVGGVHKVDQIKSSKGAIPLKTKSSKNTDKHKAAKGHGHK